MGHFGVRMEFTNQFLIDEIPKGNLRALARLITLIENRVPRAREVQAALFSKAGKVHVVGVTGSPGAGKSTLVDALAVKWRALGKRVAIIAVDPTSPFTGGAVLGDRIRMNAAIEDPEIFIRSMATRGALGGLSHATYEVVEVLGAAGFDVVIIETVGVGQGEVDVVRLSDTCVVVLVPGMGDSVQAIKAGIMEIADLFVINKSDREGADSLHKDIRILLSLSDYASHDWKPPILKTIATKVSGIDEVVEQSSNHFEWLNSSGHGMAKRVKNMEEIIMRVAIEQFSGEVLSGQAESLFKMAQKCVARESNPYSCAQVIVKGYSKGSV